MMKKYFYALVVSCFFMGCASLKEHQKKTCNYESAYAIGINDAQEGRPMKSNIAEGCDEQDKEAVSRGYREGYTSVLKQKKLKQTIENK
jgi:hypothetical protein